MSNIERLGNDLTSWYWWLTVVIVAIVVNICSAYGKDGIDKFCAKRSLESRRLAEQRDLQFSIAVKVLTSSDTLLTQACIEQIRLLLVAVFYLGISIISVFGFARAVEMPPSHPILDISILVFVPLAQITLLSLFLSTLRKEIDLSTIIQEAKRQLAEVKGDST